MKLVGVALVLASMDTPSSDCPHCGGSALWKKKKPPWRKVLYLPQPYPDNFVDASFLAKLLLNGKAIPLDVPVVVMSAPCTAANRRSYSYWDAVLSSSVVLQQQCCVVFFCMVFLASWDSSLTLNTLVAAHVAVNVVGYSIYLFWARVDRMYAHLTLLRVLIFTHLSRARRVEQCQNSGAHLHNAADIGTCFEDLNYCLHGRYHMGLVCRVLGAQPRLV